MKTTAVRKIGNGGDLILQNANGEQYVKITPRMEIVGITFLTIMPEVGRTDGEKTVYSA
jgi:hypothetical protein